MTLLQITHPWPVLTEHCTGNKAQDMRREPVHAVAAQLRVSPFPQPTSLPAASASRALTTELLFDVLLCVCVHLTLSVTLVFQGDLTCYVRLLGCVVVAGGWACPTVGLIQRVGCAQASSVPTKKPSAWDVCTSFTNSVCWTMRHPFRPTRHPLGECVH